MKGCLGDVYGYPFYKLESRKQKTAPGYPVSHY